MKKHFKPFLFLATILLFVAFTQPAFTTEPTTESAITQTDMETSETAVETNSVDSEATVPTDSITSETVVQENSLDSEASQTTIQANSVDSETSEAAAQANSVDSETATTETAKTPAPKKMKKKVIDPELERPTIDTFMYYLGELNNIVWGPGMLILLVGTGLYLTVGLNFFTFKNIGAGLIHTWKGRSTKSTKGEITPFQALMTALAADIGTGNIVGVATAIAIGGPGALFWMWVTALVGMSTKFCEILLAIQYREKTEAGNWVGGAMYVIKNALGPKWLWMGSMFAFFGIFACIGTGAMVQGNAISNMTYATMGVPKEIIAIVLFLLITAVIIGGVKRIGAFAGKVVPAMAIVYIIMALIVIALNIEEVPSVFMHVIKEAFTPTAAEGGFVGATVMLAIRMGMARGIFSNEAGLGTAPIAHAAALTNRPLEQAAIGMLDTFLDTIIVCSMTGFAILVTGVWTADPQLNAGVLTSAAFGEALPFGDYAVTICLMFFAFTTILGWCVYGERCAIYFFGDRGQMPFRIFYCLMVPVGVIVKLDLVWLIADTCNALMAFPNLLALLILSPAIFKFVKEETQKDNIFRA